MDVLVRQEGNRILLDYDEKIELSILQGLEFSSYNLIDCPLDKRKTMEEVFDYSVTFVEKEQVEEVINEYRRRSVVNPNENWY